MNAPTIDTTTTLVLGATGKTGRRLTHRLRAAGLAVREGSRTAATPFSWEDRSTWPAVLDGATQLYLCYAPDLALPGAVAQVRALLALARGTGLRRVVLLSGRGEEEAQRAEAVVQDAGFEWTILRASWFSQNFSEGYMQPALAAGELILPAGGVPEPFVDADDIADAAFAALTEDHHGSRIYELTGPRALTFAQAVGEIAAASGREMRYVQVAHADFLRGVEQDGVPPDYVWLLDYLFRTVLDGRNTPVRDGVQEALGRPPRDFALYAREAALAGAWNN
ncbi:hypothetical protein [Niveibacterium sp. SC-1]|uniref:hypothetical protein n=1 Tax=Niveibacterium sp. SC-1 TaxID=3135646 RepID=UPI00311F283F